MTAAMLLRDDFDGSARRLSARGSRYAAGPVVSRPRRRMAFQRATAMALEHKEKEDLRRCGRPQW